MGPEDAATSDPSGGPPDLPDWWPRARELEALSPEVAGVVRRIQSLLPRSVDTLDLDDRRGSVDELSAETVWTALATVHGLLDEALSEGAPLAEVETYRRRLLRLGRRWSDASVREEGTAYRRLLRDVSHDIRSPLNSILFLADGLLSEQNGSLNPVQQRQMGVVYSAAASLLNLVNDLLDFASTTAREEPEIARVPFSVENALSDVEHLLAPIADHHGTRFDVDVAVEDPRIGDPQALCRLVLNLASNALEAAPAEGRVAVKVSEEEEGETLRVDVEDDGEGVDLEEVRRLVRPQTKTRATRMLQGSTHGLGLIICGRMVRSVDGDLEVGHVEDGGSRFTLRLPFPRA